VSAIGEVLDELLATLRVGRVTLRRDLVDERGRNFPVTDEVLAAGAGSIKDEEYTDIFTSPVARRVAAGEQVVQDDSRSCYPDDPEFRSMLVEYGGLGAQIVTPAVAGERVVGIVSAHHLGPSRAWTPEEIAACRRAADRVAGLIGA
jgi:GAF domain-containing protein